jgi:type VI protein secretion system component VasF
MTMRFRHDITGSEVGRPRPPAYMRRGRTRRSRSARLSRRAPVWRLAALALLLLLGIGLQQALGG